MFTAESHVISMSLLLLRFSTYRAAACNLWWTG